MNLRRLIFFLLFLSFDSFAGDLKLDNLSSKDFEGLSKEFSANFIHTAVSPASPLGDIIGFELGVVGSVTKTPELEALSKKVDPTNSGLTSIPYAALLGSVSVPFGLTFELSYLPETTASSITIDSYGAGIKWTFDKLFFDIPFLDLALRGHYSNSSLEFSQTVSGVKSDLTLDDKIYGLSLMVSANVLIFEPFASIGYVKASADLSSSLSSSSLFAFTSASTSSTDISSAQLVVGAQINLFLMRFSAEVMRVFGTTRYSGKLTFGF